MRASGATEAPTLYLAERARRLEREWAWENRPPLSRVIDAVLVASGCLLIGVGVFGAALVLYEKWRRGDVWLGGDQTGSPALGPVFVTVFAGIAAMGAAGVYLGARTWWLSR